MESGRSGYGNSLKLFYGVCDDWSIPTESGKSGGGNSLKLAF